MSERTLSVADGVGGAGFVQVPREQLGELTPNALALHVALLSYGWHGSCWPGMEALEARTQLGERALRTAKRELIDAGLLDEKRRGQGKPNLYTVRTWEQRRIQNVQNSGSADFVSQDEVEEDQVEEEDSLRSSSSPRVKQSESRSDRQDVDALCMKLAALMRDNDPKVKIPDTAGKWKRWQDAARLLIDRDERHFEEASAVLEFALTDEFWKTNILSMPTFREKYDQLRAKWVGSRQRVIAARATFQQPTTADLMAAYGRRDDPQAERRRRAGAR